MVFDFNEIEKIRAKVAAFEDFDDAGLFLARVQNDFSVVPDPVKFPKLSSDEWVDMTKSVNWNIAKRDELNRAYYAEADRLIALRNEASDIIRERLIQLLAEYMLIPVDVAVVVYNKAFEMSHYDGVGAVIDTFVNDLAPLVVDCLKVYDEVKNAKQLPTEKEVVTNG